MNILEDIKKKVPELPGCYIYSDKDKIIYVGKAKNLKKRMISYFSRENNFKTKMLVENIVKYDFYITRNENEALILENNLIKKHQPFYNIVLKDDKKYPYIVITHEEYPKLIKSRNRNIKGKYYGPLPSGKIVTDIIKYLDSKTMIIKCRVIPKKECIYFHINQCYAPCIKKVEKEYTIEEVNKLKKLLDNDFSELIKILKKDIQKDADLFLYEDAQKKKNLLEGLVNVKDSQYVQLENKISVTVFDYYSDGNFIALSLVEIEDGKIINIHRSLLPIYDNDENTIITYVHNYYLERKKPEYLLDTGNKLNLDIGLLLNINIMKVSKNIQSSLKEIASSNTREYYKKNSEKILKEYFKNNLGYEELKNITKNKLERIEMFDVSHNQGASQVASMVVYKNGKKDTKEYRKFKIDERNKRDDYGSLKEVILRRIKRSITENNIANLIIVDGGEKQVKAIMDVINKYKEYNNVLVIGLKKDDKHKTKSIINKNLEEKILSKRTDLYKFLYQIQEEVHRFAINYHQKLESKSLFKSKLDEIEGIGDVRKKILMEKYEYFENIQNATEEELIKLKIPKKIIKNIKNIEYTNK